MKRQVTFEKKGINVIKDIQKYLKNHPEDNENLEKLLEFLQQECTESLHCEDGSINWLFAIIEQRDEIVHLSRAEHFAFQVNNIKGEKAVFPPNLTRDQSMKDAFRIAYGNLLIVIQDFIALLLGPHLNEHFTFFSFHPEEVKDESPKWYIMLKGFQQFGLGSVRQNPQVVAQFAQAAKVPFSSLECMVLHQYYNSFLK